MIVVDNASTDPSVDIIKSMLGGIDSRIVMNPKNAGYAGGLNAGFAVARGEWLIGLADDTWLEPDCIEQLVKFTQLKNADAAVPSMHEYNGDLPVATAPQGFDLSGRATYAKTDADPLCAKDTTRECFYVGGNMFLIRRSVFMAVGGFDETFFRCADEDELSWSLWTAGFSSIFVPSARFHHRDGNDWAMADDGRFYIVRNTMVVLLEYSQFWLFACVPVQIALLLVEAVFMWIFRWGTKMVWQSYVMGLLAVIPRIPHIIAQRKKIRLRRRRGDLWMIRKFMHIRINRLDQLLSNKLTKISVHSVAQH
jgi:GT2 family glycosyltransferase